MTSNYNKRKLSFSLSPKLIKYLLLIFTIFSILILTYNELVKKNRFYFSVDIISKKFSYELSNYELNSLNRVDKDEVIKIINKYMGKSIFLLPLSEISNNLSELNWVKKVNISINFKDKINIEIFEYNPIGLYSYNNQLYYFSKQGKIIDRAKLGLNEKYIIFNGKNVLKHANDFLNHLENIQKDKIPHIKEASYVNERRWDIILHNNILINLSEEKIEDSIKNYNKLINNFKISEINTIKRIDLRNNQKAIISFK